MLHKGATLDVDMAEEAHHDEQEGNDKEDDGAQALRFNGQLGDDSVDGDDQSRDALPSHHRLGVSPREHARETIVARLLNCTVVCVCVCVCMYVCDTSDRMCPLQWDIYA